MRSWTTEHSDDDARWHTVHVEFTYELGEYRYTNRAARREGDAIAKEGAEDMGEAWQGLLGYAPGTRVTVYYDPAEPEPSVLDPRRHDVIGCYAALALFGLAAITAGAAIITWIVLQQPWRSPG